MATASLSPSPAGAACCEHHEHSGLDHGHAKVNLALAVFGGILLVTSLLARKVYGTNDFRVTLSAVLGALVLGLPICLAAARDLLRHRIHMDVIVALALLAAIVMQYYLEAGIIAFFMLLAITIEEKTAIGARTSIEALIKLTPTLARRLDPQTGAEAEVEALSLRVGDVVRVRPGENFPSDGKVTRGVSTVNQASITGESLPVDKDEGDEVYAGTQNLTGMVEVRVTGVGHDTTLGKVRDLIVQAERTRLPILRMVDQYAVYYTPTVLMIATVVWFLTGDLMRFVYVMVIACPCALVVATPSAVVAAIAAAARLGMLIKNVAHIETAAKVRAIVFDKTGTLTEGKLEVARLAPAAGVELTDLLAAAVTAEAHSNHPAASAMRRLAEEAKVQWAEPQEYTEVAGKGVIAKLADGTVRVGRRRWLEECGVAAADLDAAIPAGEDIGGMSIVYVARGTKVLGWIGLRDAIRPQAKAAIEELHRLGIRRCCMVTGDNEGVARTVARRLGISEVRAECLPAGKVEYVESLKAAGLAVAVVGDGVNDAPALAAGDIGVAMGAIGSDVAVSSASIALMNNDLRRIPFLIALSRKTRTIINLNLLIGAALIIGGLMLFTFGDEALNHLAKGLGVDAPVFKASLAALVHIFGTLVVVFNSARLVRFGEELAAQPAAPAGPPATAAPAAPAAAQS